MTMPKLFLLNLSYQQLLRALTEKKITANKTDHLTLLLIITSVSITPIKCVTCRFYLTTNSFYGCEMFEVNVTESNV
ncbi:CLUMA_CG019002, isoform A [Clunio marinus]|uniref:CLUMA_CG019002, isoform A n=1 Tax=Clunio marinus TaxID=568069 RepID=A0A1J1J0R6_9DIPT|nr:CLUMA_CG019002, isoform A [Clunio marinus]